MLKQVTRTRAIFFSLSAISYILISFAFLYGLCTRKPAAQHSWSRRLRLRLSHIFPLQYSLAVPFVRLTPCFKDKMHAISEYRTRTALLVISLLLSSLFLLAPSASATPTTMNFQGRLLDAAGVPVADGLYNMQFKLYDASTGGTQLWTETRENSTPDYRVQVTNGLFTAKLGQRTALSASLFSGSSVYFEITQATPATATCATASCATWESPMTPRHQLSTSAYAFNSDTLDGLDSTAFAAASGSGSYIQNRTSPQTADFTITGTGTASTIQATVIGTPIGWGSLVIGNANTTDITIADNTTIAAGMSLTLTGGTRPASPTGGMLYYDTTTKQLLVYDDRGADSKWQADSKTATVIVAASNSPQAIKDGAQYVATGTNDQSTINNAISALPAVGGSVYLAPGTYTIAGSISPASNSSIIGAGATSIVKVVDNNTTLFHMITSGATKVTLRDFTVDYNSSTNSGGGNAIDMTTSDNLYTNLWIKNVSTNAMMLGSRARVVNNNYENASNISAWGGASPTGVVISGNTFSATNVTVEGTNHTITGNSFYNASLNINSNDTTASGNSFNTTTNNPAIFSQNGQTGVVMTGNTITGATGSFAARIDASNSIFSNNDLHSNNVTVGALGVLNSSTNVQVSNNRLYDNGGTSSASSIYLGYSSCPIGTQIANNYVTDTAGTGYAIQIACGTSIYLSGNAYSGTGAASINDLGTYTRYSNQMDGAGNLINNNLGAMTLGTSTVSSTFSLQGGMTTTTLPTPSTPVITNGGTAGAVSYSYTVTALDGIGETIASSAGSTATGNATLTAGNYNIVTWNSVSGATSYKVYRTASGGTPSSTGLIATVTTKLGATQVLNDTGLAGSGTSPTTNTTGSASFAGSMQGGSSLTLGTASTTDGVLVLKNGTNANTITLQTGATSSSYSLTLPTALGSTGQCLSDTTGAGVLGWATCVDANLSNLGTTSIAVDLLPESTDAYNLGASNDFWHNGYFGGSLFSPALRPVIDGTTALLIQNTAGTTTLMTFDTSGNAIQIGSSTTDATAIELTLDSYNGTSDPTATNGSMYYNTSSNRMRCAEGSTATWRNCTGLSPMNNSTATQAMTAGTDVYLNGSVIPLPIGGFKGPTVSGSQNGTLVTWTVTMSKTAAGTAASSFNIRVGTNGTTADTARCTAFSTGTATAASDWATVTITALVTAGGSSTTLNCSGMLRHNLTTTGFSNAIGVTAYSTAASFDSTAAGTKIGLSLNAGASSVITVQQVQAVAINL